MNYQEIKRKIKEEAQLIKIETTLGTAAKITKKEAYRLLDTLEGRRIEPKIEFEHIHNSHYLVIISS